MRKGLGSPCFKMERQGIQIGKEVKHALSANVMTLYKENPNGSTRKLLELMNKNTNNFHNYHCIYFLSHTLPCSLYPLEVSCRYHISPRHFCIFLLKRRTISTITTKLSSCLKDFVRIP